MKKLKLAIIIAAYDMQREVPRTVMSALPPLQRDVDPEEYEILVVDNGSDQPLQLDEILHRYSNVRLLRIPSEQASSTPSSCINDAARSATDADAVLICVDGARMFSACLVRRTIDSLQRQPSAATFVQSRHLGSENQAQAVRKGYDQRREDELLASVSWESDLDALFEISVLAGAHSPSTPLFQNESNAVGLRRDQWLELGGYNEDFRRPGGGLCNLELFDRLMARGTENNILLMGEATFHQVHGGVATSSLGYFGDSLNEYRTVVGAEYERPPANFMIDVQTDYDRLKRAFPFA